MVIVQEIGFAHSHSVLFADFCQDALQAVETSEEPAVWSMMHFSVCIAHGRSVLDFECGMCKVDHSHICQSEGSRTSAISTDRSGLGLRAKFSSESVLHLGCYSAASGLLATVSL